MSILRVRDATGKFVAIPSIKGEKGDKGDAGSVTAVNGAAPDGSGNVRVEMPRNLLDNSNFKNPVNQRGVKNGEAIAKYAYFLDRWMSGSSEAKTLTMNGSGISLPMIKQTLPKETVPNGMNVTAACRWSDGTTQVAARTITRGDTWAWSASSVTDGALIGIVDDGTGSTYVRIDNDNGKTLVWAALYEGTYTAETLPPYVPKGYAAELMECRRYFMRIGNGYFPCAFGLKHSLDETTCRAVIPIPATMRIHPTCTITGSLSDFRVSTGSGYKTLADMTAQSAEGQIELYLTLDSEWNDAGAFALYATDGSSKINLSADL